MLSLEAQIASVEQEIADIKEERKTLHAKPEQSEADVRLSRMLYFKLAQLQRDVYFLRISLHARNEAK